MPTHQKGGEQVFNDLAVCFSTGWGDGTYPVYATKEDGRIARIEVDMAGDDQETGLDDQEEV